MENPTNEIEKKKQQNGINELNDEGILDINTLADKKQTVVIGKLVAEDNEIQEDTEDTVKISPDYEEKQSGQNFSNKNRTYKIFQSAHICFHLFLAEDMVREKEFFRLSEQIYFYERERYFKINGRQIQVPDQCQAYVSDQQIVLVLTDNQNSQDTDCKKIIIQINPEFLLLGFDNYQLKLSGKSTAYIDKKGSIAFNFDKYLTVINPEQGTIRCGGYLIFTNSQNQFIETRGNWLRFSEQCAFDAENGILKFGGNKIKCPANTIIKTSSQFLDLYIQGSKDGIKRKLHFLYQGDRLELRSAANSILLGKNTSCFIDKNGNLVFDYQNNLAVVCLPKKFIKIGKVSINLYRGQNIKINEKWLHLNELIKLAPESALIRYGKSKIAYSGAMVLKPQPGQLAIHKKNKNIILVPSNKQLFIRVGGKLVIVTVTIGIAMDQNGNLAFDYKGNLSILDTNFFVLTIDKVKMDFSQVAGICVELIGNNVVVSGQDQKKNFLELFRQALMQKGLMQLLQDSAQLNVNAEDILELLLNLSSSQEVLSLLSELGLKPDSNLQDLLKNLLGEGLLSDILSSDPNNFDLNQLMLLMANAKTKQLLLSGKNIPLPSAQELAEHVSLSGNIPDVLALIKNHEIKLLTLNKSR
ncbi:MAG: hypothetical protein PHV30_08815 [Candidatus Margulisbacteria bacterium]|nr:hypothetical protein [Candidatus Margulisiibacteriota bacterium]